MAWPVCFACGAKAAPEVDRDAEIFNRHEAVIIRSYRCKNPECPRGPDGRPWTCWTAEKVIEERPPILWFRKRRWHIKLIDRVMVLFDRAQPVGRK